MSVTWCGAWEAHLSNCVPTVKRWQPPGGLRLQQAGKWKEVRHKRGSAVGTVLSTCKLTGCRVRIRLSRGKAPVPFSVAAAPQCICSQYDVGGLGAVLPRAPAGLGPNSRAGHCLPGCRYRTSYTLSTCSGPHSTGGGHHWHRHEGVAPDAACQYRKIRCGH
jgi:hypothetical protein